MGRRVARAQKPAPSEPVTRIRAPRAPANAGTAPGARVSDDMLTVRHLVQSFDSHLAVRVKIGQAAQSTVVWYRSQLRKLTAAVGDSPAADLRAHHLVDVKFTYHFVRALRTLYKWAADDDVELVPRNPFRKLAPPPCGERQRVLSRAEMRRLYLASAPAFRRFLFVLSRTLARPGEIRALRWGDIQWDRRLITLKEFKGKSRRGDGVKLRTIPLDRPSLRMLRNMFERRGRPGPDAPVWLDRFKKQLTRNGLRCRMRRAREAAELDAGNGEERVVLYTMRHTGATNATRRGVTDNTLARVMGHARTATTNRYQHLAGDDLVEAIDRVTVRRGSRSASPGSSI